MISTESFHSVFENSARTRKNVGCCCAVSVWVHSPFAPIVSAGDSYTAVSIKVVIQKAYRSLKAYTTDLKGFFLIMVI